MKKLDCLHLGSWKLNVIWRRRKHCVCWREYSDAVQACAVDGVPLGRTTLRSAETGTDHLYFADEDVWLANVSTNGGFRVTQHFRDVLGHETNTVVSIGLTPGEAASATWRSPFAAASASSGSSSSSSSPSSSSLLSSSSSIASLSSLVSLSSTRYPDGHSDYAIHTDARGVETLTWREPGESSEYTDEIVSTNDVEVLRTTTTRSACASTTNAYAANALNQYTSILRVSVPPCETVPSYDADGNLVSLGPWTYAYDAANRLMTVSSNGVLLVTNAYDAQGCRVRKTTPGATTTFFYDGWNLVEERIAHTNGTTSTVQYHWGKDLSGSLQGAGGIGGLLYLKIDGAIYIPLYDVNGNVTQYLDANGSVVASYTYDTFGNLLSQSGDLADTFAFRFSTKYYDVESNLYSFGKRFYLPTLRRWLNRDPIEEQGGVNLYGFCGNNALVNLGYCRRFG